MELSIRWNYLGGSDNKSINDWKPLSGWEIEKNNKVSILDAFHTFEEHKFY